MANIAEELAIALGHALWPTEQQVLDELRNGYGRRLTRTDRRTVSGEFVRALWRHATEPRFRNELVNTFFRLRLHHLEVSSELNLSEFLTSPQSPLIGIDFINCNFPRSINLSHLHFSRLSLSHCAFESLSLVRSTIQSDLIITSCAPLNNCSSLDSRKVAVAGDVILSGTWFAGEKGEKLGLNLRGAQIGGALIINKAGTRSTHVVGGLDLREASIGSALDGFGLIADGMQDDAIDARGLSVGRSVILDGANVVGSCSFRRARVGDDFVASNTKFESNDAFGVRLEWVTIGRAAIFDKMRSNSKVLFNNATVGGDINFNRAHISVTSGYALDLTDSEAGRLFAQEAVLEGGGIEADGVRIRGPAYFEKSIINAGIAKDSLRLGGAKIGGLLSCDELVTRGKVDLIHAQIGGGCTFVRARLSNPAGDAINGLHASIGGTLELRNGFVAEGLVALSHAMIDGNFAAEGGTFKNPGSIALDFVRASVKGSVYLRRSGSDKGFIPFTVEGGIAGGGAKIDRDIEFLGSTITTNAASQEIERAELELPALVDFSGARVGGQFRLFETKITGLLRLNSAKIDGSLDVAASSFSPMQATAIEAFRIEIGNALNFYRIDTTGDFRFDGCKVGGRVRWYRFLVCIRTTARTHHPIVLSFKAGDLGQRLRAKRLEVAVDAKGPTICIVDMTAAKVESLEDDLPDGWGPPGQVQIRLDGFHYDRILLPRGADESLARLSRRRWLEQQFSSGRSLAIDYRPQAYQALAIAQANSGDQQEARHTIVTGERHRRQANMLNGPEKIASILFEVLFGLGLSKTRALLTFAATLVLISLIVIGADRTGFLVRYVGPGKLGTTQCGEALDPFLYAIEYSVPFAGSISSARCVVGLASWRNGQRQIEFRNPFSVLGPIPKAAPAVRGATVHGIATRKTRVQGNSLASKPPQAPVVVAFDGVVFWDVALALTKLLGWTVTSLTIFTFSGLMRRFTFSK